MRLIDADALLEIFDETARVCGNDALRRQMEIYLDAAPTITPDSLVKRGRWIDGRCTNCAWEAPDTVNYYGYEDENWVYTKFCPNCGALMEG